MSINDLPPHLEIILKSAITNECVLQATSVDVDEVTHECELAVVTRVENGDVFLCVIYAVYCG